MQPLSQILSSTLYKLPFGYDPVLVLDMGDQAVNDSFDALLAISRPSDLGSVERASQVEDKR